MSRYMNVRVEQSQSSDARVETINRRDLMKYVGAAGVATAGLVTLGSRAGAHQDAPVMATPQLGAQADGSTIWKVIVGGMDMENMVEFHGFFPGEITINAGDSIWFANEMPMFHTLTFPGTGGEIPALFLPDPELDPATVQAGPPKLIFNPVLITGQGGTVVDGSQLVSTSVDVFGDGVTPWIFSFPTAGTYDYVCTPHAGVMQGKVIVQEAGSALPMDQAAIDAAAAEALAALQVQGVAEIEKYSTPVSTPKDGGGNLWEVAAGAGGFTQVRVQRMLPNPLEIAVGDSIKFINQSEGEPHTVSFIGEGETPPEDTIVESFADGSPKFVQSMETFLPQGGNTWSGTGFVNSGFMGIPQLGLPMEWEVLFDTPGEYIYWCILHGDPNGERMAATLTVV